MRARRAHHRRDQPQIRAEAVRRGPAARGPDVSTGGVSDRLPPLREREGDAELLAEHFLRQLNTRAGNRQAILRAAVLAIRTHHWPGNVRELKNAVHRGFIMAERDVDLDLAGYCLPCRGRELPSLADRNSARGDRSARRFSRRSISVPATSAVRAEILGVSLKTLYNRLAAYQAGASRETPYRAADSPG